MAQLETGPSVGLFAILLLGALKFSNCAAVKQAEFISELDALSGTFQNVATMQMLKLPALSASIKEALFESWLELKVIPDLFTEASDFGYSYQFVMHPSRKKAQTNIQIANKETSRDEVIAFTQLYTPSWVSEFLLQNAILPQISKEQRKGVSAQYLLNDLDYAKSSIDSITVLDPCCGGGNILVKAFDLLFDLHVLSGRSVTDATASALAQCIGIDIDQYGLFVCFIALIFSCRKRTGTIPKLDSIRLTNAGNFLLGSLDPSIVASTQFSAIVTNPPYLGRKLMSRELKEALKTSYPDSYSDLSAPFLQRSVRLLKPGGRLGFITQASMLSLPSYNNLREILLNETNMESCIDLGTGAFPLQSGEKVNSVLLVAMKKTAVGKLDVELSAKKLESHASTDEPKTQECMFIDLTQTDQQPETLCDLNTSKTPNSDHLMYKKDPRVFESAGSNAFLFKCPEPLFEFFRSLPKLESIADVRQGLATTDNKTFVRYVWEIDQAQLGTKWFPYVKGSGSDRWTSPVTNVVNFAYDGREIKAAVMKKYPYLKGKTAWVVKNEQYYFREGLCFSFVSTDDFAVRRLPAGCIFDVAASSIFAEPQILSFLLAYLNSDLVRAICKTINPTINMQVGDVKNLPLFTFSSDTVQQLSALADQCCNLKSFLDGFMQPSIGLEPNKTGYQVSESPNRQIQQVLQGDHPHEIFKQIAYQIRSAAQDLTDVELQINRMIIENAKEIRALVPEQIHKILAWISSTETSARPHTATTLCEPKAAAAMALTQCLVQNANHNDSSKMKNQLTTSLDGANLRTVIGMLTEHNERYPLHYLDQVLIGCNYSWKLELFSLR